MIVKMEAEDQKLNIVPIYSLEDYKPYVEREFFYDQLQTIVE